MRLQIRNGTFETNSSSTHSLVVYNDYEEPEKCKIDFILGEYGWEWGEVEFSDYFYTALCLPFCEWRKEREYTEEELEKKKEAVSRVEEFKRFLYAYNVEYTMEEFDDMENYNLGNNFYIDHQSQPSDEWIVDTLSNWDTLSNYMFGSYVITGNDNCCGDEIDDYLPEDKSSYYVEYL